MIRKLVAGNERDLELPQREADEPIEYASPGFDSVEVDVVDPR